MAHRYVTFRIHLARHALRQFAASLKSSAEILALGFAQVLIGLFAVIALPPMYAASLPCWHPVPLLAAHALLMSLPMLLLRKRVLPLDVLRWQHALPISLRTQFAADAAVAGMLCGPLALAYLLSGAIWLYQSPDWLLPSRAVAGTLFSFLLTWACASAILTMRARRPAAAAPWQRRLPAAASAYRPRTPAFRLPHLWHRLFWLPFWRADNVVGLQQLALLLAAMASALAWTMAPPGIARGLLGLMASASLVLLTDRGDKAVREQIDLLRPLIAAWPMAARPLEAWARAFSLAPAGLAIGVLALAGAGHGLWDRTAGQAYLILACVAQLLLVAIPRFSPRGRVGLVVVSIVILTAVGSESWQ